MKFGWRLFKISFGYIVEGRTIVNLDGLINNPEYFHSLQDGQGAVFLDRLGLDFVNGSSAMLTTSNPYR
jgi:hypothetical protein